MPEIRPGRDSDADGFIALIAACWSQYPGVVLDVDQEVPELRALARYYGAQGGALWAAEQDGAVVGMIAVRPHQDGAWEVCRVYVHPALHGAGLGPRLLDLAEAHARSAGATRLVLWSDTRFDRAHRFYEKRSYVRRGPIRVLDDISHSLEFAYAKPVNGIEVLDAAAAASAVSRLATLRRTCGTAPEEQDAFWKNRASEIAAHRTILVAGWLDGDLAGAVALAFAAAADGPHRAIMRGLAIHPEARHGGLARALIRRAEQEAVRAGRSLLVTKVFADSAAEHAVRAEAWAESGRVPGYALAPDGSPRDALFFWKRVA